MHTLTITNPKTNRKNICRAWRIDPRKVICAFNTKRFRTAKDLSWALLSDDESVADMEATQYGDAAECNFALSIFETALDWTLGLAVLRLIESCPKGKILKPFTLCANRNGDVFYLFQSGKILQY